MAITPSLQAASTIKQWSHTVGDLDITGLIDELRQQAATGSGGDLKRQEAMLATQAHTLDTIFNELARRCQANMGEYLDAADRCMRLALKAQSQCRATIETLAETKNPKPVAFVQQANIATGPQQVNNAPQPETSRTGELENPPNKLLEQQREQWLDTRTSNASVETDPELAPWEKSAGPRTVEGKAGVAGNAYRGATRVTLRTVARLLRDQQECL